MVFKEDGQNNREVSNSHKKVDVEIKSVKAMREIQEQFADFFMQETPEGKEITDIGKEAKNYNNTLLQQFAEKFKNEIDTGEIRKTMANLQKYIEQNGYETAVRNKGAGFALPMQLALRQAGYDDIVADGVIGKKTKEAIEDYQYKNYLKPTGQFDVATINLLKGSFVNPKQRETFKPKLTQEQKETAENERINKNYKRVLMDYFVNSPTRPKIENLFPNTNLMTNDGQGITSVDFGPKNPNLYTDKAWLDLTKFDFKKNPTITLSLHHNKGNFPGTFDVNVMKFTKQAPDGSVKIDQGKLYALTAANYRDVARAQTNFATPVKKKATV